MNLVNRTRIVQEAVAIARLTPFAWDGVNDCLGWAASVAYRLTGKDLMQDLRGLYSTELEARRVMRRKKWGSMSDIVRTRGLLPIPPAMGCSGDWAIIVNPDGTDTVSVFCNEWVVARSPTGIGMVSRLQATEAFRIL